MEFQKPFLRLSLLLIMVLASVSAGDEDFLYAGCKITNGASNVYADTLPIYLEFPPKPGFSLTVTQDNRHTLTFRGMEPINQRWTLMELVMKDQLELRFQNGTTWLKEDEGSFLYGVPEKKIQLSGGYMLPECPQGLPHWLVKRHVEPVDVIVEEGKEVVFSLITTRSTTLNFKVGNERLVLCWNADLNQMIVVPQTDSGVRCSSLQSHTLMWMTVSHKSQMVKIIDPSQSSDLRSFYIDDKNCKVTFDNDAIDGTAYVVRHLKGFPALHQQEHQHHHHHAMQPLDMCMWISTIIGVLIFLILVVFVLLAALFYNRWINARRVLLLLQTMDAKKQKKAGAKTNKDERIRKTSMPSYPPPLPQVSSENHYLTPREAKSLRTVDNRPKSEHIYEDLTEFFSKAKANKALKGVSKEYLAFEKTAPEGGVSKENLAFEKTATDEAKKKAEA